MTRPHGGQLLTSIVEPAPQRMGFYGSAGVVAADSVEEGERVLRLPLER